MPRDYAGHKLHTTPVSINYHYAETELQITMLTLLQKTIACYSDSD